MGLLWWIPALALYFWWRKRYNVGAKFWEFEMPLMKKDVYIIKWNFHDEPARLETQPATNKK